MNPNSHSGSKFAARLPWVAAVSLASLLAACNQDNTSATASATPSSTSSSNSNAAYATNTTTGSSGDMASTSKPADYNTTSKAADTGSRSDRPFWKKAKLASQREYAYSQLAVAQASDPRVRSFAQQIVSDHQQMSQDFRSTTGRDMTMDNDVDVNSTSADMNHTGARTGDPSMAALPSSGMSSSASGSTYNPDAAARRDQINADANQNGTSEDHPRTSDQYPNGVPSSAGTSDHTGAATSDPSMAALPSSGMSSSASGTAYNPDAAARRAQINADANQNGTSEDHPRTTDAYPNGAPVIGASGSTTGTTGTNTNGTSTWSRDDWMKKDHAYSRLAGKSGADFDRAYLDLIIAQEKKTVSLYGKAGKIQNSGDNQEQMFASSHLEAHRQRLDQAQALQKTI